MIDGKVMWHLTAMANYHRDSTRRLIAAHQPSTTGAVAEARVKGGTAAAPTARRAMMAMCTYSTVAKACAVPCGSRLM